MKDLEERVGKLYWQLELLLKVHPQVIDAALDEMKIAPNQSDGQPRTVEALLAVLQSCGSRWVVDLLRALSKHLADETEIFERELASHLESQADSIEKVLKSPAWVFSQFVTPSVIPCSTIGIPDGFERLFDPLLLQSYGKSLCSGNQSRSEHLALIFRQLINSGPYRKFSFENDTLQKLELFKKTAANFEKVIDYVMDAINLAIKYHRPVSITPILLLGEPGVGKTYFSNRLAEILGVPSRNVAMDNFQTGSALAGSSYVWSNSERGMVFKSLTEGDHISPLIILDEIDKANNTFAQGGDSLSPLHNLLEPESAKKFKDAAFDLTIDASHVFWIATTNRSDKLPDSLKSRFAIFKIQSPNLDERDNVLREICRELTVEYPGIEFDEGIFTELRTETPREQRQMLRRALARASRLDDSKVTTAHLKLVANEKGETTRGFGFQKRAG